MTKDEALKKALEALEKYAHDFGSSDLSVKAMYVARKTLAQRTWVGLTDEELPPLVGDNGKYMELQQVRRFYKYIEAKLKEKNNG